MPDLLFSSGSKFDTSKTVLWQWLNNNADVVKTLALKNLTAYTNKNFKCGWHTELNYNNENFLFHILVDSNFPYSPIRIAYKTDDKFLQWPHVEPYGLLCLPIVDTEDIEAQVKKLLLHAIELIENCQKNDKYREDEFQKEFISYWGQSNKSISIKSLLDTNNTASRLIYIWNNGKIKLVGENIEQLKIWLKNLDCTFNPSMITTGVFGLLSTPPIPPFPNNPRSLIKTLNKNSNGITSLLAKIPFHQSTLIVLGAKTENSGIGLVAVELNAQSINGFRRNKIYRDKINLLLRKRRGCITRKDIQRLDSQWVHGRDQNTGLKYLKESKVLILGCGSLGSQVAMRLAQSGVGELTLIDHDLLVPANVGRHALGIDSINSYKAYKLKLEIQRKYPHILKVKHYPRTWQQVFNENPEVFSGNNLIISCMGEWSAEGQLSDWQDSLAKAQPIIYGWLDENGTASHAVAIVDKSISLKCIINDNGTLRAPETEWSSNRSIQTEPACGTAFQPYGPVDVCHAEALVTQLAIEFLTHKISKSTHKVYAGPTSKIEEANGKWSTEHLKYRPNGFKGAFEYEKSELLKCGICSQCGKK